MITGPQIEAAWMAMRFAPDPQRVAELKKRKIEHKPLKTLQRPEPELAARVAAEINAALTKARFAVIEALRKKTNDKTKLAEIDAGRVPLRIPTPDIVELLQAWALGWGVDKLSFTEEEQRSVEILHEHARMRTLECVRYAVEKAYWHLRGLNIADFEDHQDQLMTSADAQENVFPSNTDAALEKYALLCLIELPRLFQCPDSGLDRAIQHQDRQARDAERSQEGRQFHWNPFEHTLHEQMLNAVKGATIKQPSRRGRTQKDTWLLAEAFSKSIFFELLSLDRDLRYGNTLFYRCPDCHGKGIHADFPLPHCLSCERTLADNQILRVNKERFVVVEERGHYCEVSFNRCNGPDCAITDGPKDCFHHFPLGHSCCPRCGHQKPQRPAAVFVWRAQAWSLDDLENSPGFRSQRRPGRHGSPETALYAPSAADLMPDEVPERPEDALFYDLLGPDWEECSQKELIERIQAVRGEKRKQLKVAASLLRAREGDSGEERGTK